ncbi:MAG: phosphoadenylyl-sulfate reductase [Terrimonas sp.]|nr:phosphoadenylyl-sulfate reductase [Terrimonas sp.]
MNDDQLLEKIEDYPLPEALKLVTSLFPGKVVFSSSLGQEDQVITAVIGEHQIPVDIFTLDTGRLFYEAYDLLEKTNARYKINIRVLFPDPADVEAYVLAKGVNGFYESVGNRKQCCHIRKVKPLNRALEGAKVWITGLRAAQSANRSDMKMLEWDEERQLYKFNPLIHWGYEEMISYIQQHNIPCNTLHDKGYISIGCAPCTRAIEPGEDPRAGRWWWESSQKECGLHEHLQDPNKQ